MTNDIRGAVTEAIAQAEDAPKSDEVTQATETTAESANQPDTAKQATTPDSTLKVEDSPKTEFEKAVRRDELPLELQAKYDELNKLYLRKISEKTTRFSSDLNSTKQENARLSSRIQELERQLANYPANSNKEEMLEAQRLTPEQLDQYLAKREENNWVAGQERVVLQTYPELFNQEHPDFKASTTIKVKAGVEALQNEYYEANKTLVGFDYVGAVKQVQEEIHAEIVQASKEYHERQLAELQKKKKAAQQMNPGGGITPTLPAKGSSIRDIVSSVIDASES